MMLTARYWKGCAHDLGKMTLRELVPIFFGYPAIIVYLTLATLLFGFALVQGKDPVPLGVAALVAVLVYPLIWYVLHRCILHGRFLYRSRMTANVWKRIHYDHHQDPNDLRVLFAALHTSLPTIASVTLPVGYAIGGWPAAAMAMAVGLVTTCFYEFCHCVQHLNYTPRSATLKRMKWLHMAHHFHDENGNYGITNFFWDWVLGTYYDKASQTPRSPTVYNLGYTEEEARRYPFVLEASGGRRLDRPPRRVAAYDETAGPPAGAQESGQ